jgi:hypothetical protein
MLPLVVFVAFVTDASAVAQECPRLVGRWPYGPTRVVATGDDGTVYIGSGSAFRAVDVSDPHSPQLLSLTHCDTPRWDGTIVDNLAFLARIYHDPPSGLLIVDVSDPELPYEISSCGEWHSTGVAVDSSYAYTVGTDGLHVVDVSVPPCRFPSAPSRRRGPCSPPESPWPTGWPWSRQSSKHST